MTIQQLQHFAFGNDIGGIGQNLHHSHAVNFHHHLE